MTISPMRLCAFAMARVACSVQAAWPMVARTVCEIEVHGSKGMLWLDNERMNELNLYVAEGPAASRGFRRILSSPAHPAYGKLCPAPGHGLGFNELKVIELAEILHAIQGLPSNHIDFTRGIRIEQIIHAFARSSTTQGWVSIELILALGPIQRSIFGTVDDLGASVNCQR